MLPSPSLPLPSPFPFPLPLKTTEQISAGLFSLVGVIYSFLGLANQAKLLEP